jgi:hypothetical protein
MASATVQKERARAQKLSQYLAQLSASQEISDAMALLAWRAWTHVRSATSSLLPVPDASPGPDGQLLYTWDRGEHHLELEVFENGAAEFFYRNRVSDELWEHIGTVDEAVPQTAKEKLSLFIAA